MLCTTGLTSCLPWLAVALYHGPTEMYHVFTCVCIEAELTLTIYSVASLGEISLISAS